MKEKTKLEMAFDLFVSHDQNRRVMTKPFSVDDKTYATDLYTLICCDNDKIDFSFENKEKPLNVSAIVPSINIDKVINIDNVDWDLFMTIPETIGDGNDVVCGNCNGNGECDDSTYYKNKFYYFEYECPVCKGSGLEEEEKQIPTGNKTFKSDCRVKLKDVYFNAAYFYKLKKVKDLIGGDIKLIHYNDIRKGVMFSVGYVHIILMPYTVNDIESSNIIATFS